MVSLFGPFRDFCLSSVVVVGGLAGALCNTKMLSIALEFLLAALDAAENPELFV